MRQFVRIVNRENGYTNINRAEYAIEHELAVLVTANAKGQPVEIHMLNAAELAVLQSANRQTAKSDDGVKGEFGWHVGDSGGSTLMRDYTGTTGGMRVFKARRQEKGSFTQAAVYSKGAA